MSKVFLLLNKYTDINNPTLNAPNHEYGILGSIINAGVDHECIHYDHYLYEQGKPIDEWLISHCNEVKPSMIVMPYYHYIPGVPKDDTLTKMAETAPVALMWYDSVNVGDQLSMERLSKLPLYHIAMDRDNISQYIPSKQIIRLWFTTDEDVYKPDPTVKKDIDVSFVGDVNYGQRLAFLNDMGTFGINICCPSISRKLSVPECVKYWQRSKITLNFSHAKYAKADQFKHRVCEVLQCGAFLLDSANGETAKLFDPMDDYVPFYSTEDLANKLKYYLSHEHERERIASAGYHTKSTKYSNKVFWEILQNKLTGVKG